MYGVGLLRGSPYKRRLFGAGLIHSSYWIITAVQTCASVPFDRCFVTAAIRMDGRTGTGTGRRGLVSWWINLINLADFFFCQGGGVRRVLAAVCIDLDRVVLLSVEGERRFA